ncbi:hypothetical protein IAT40_000429 [Kwoniella sp. CBS 6097]
MRSKTRKTKKSPISLTESNSHAQTTSSHRSAVSHKVTQSTIARFHTLLKQQARLKRKLQGEGGHDCDVQNSVRTDLEAVESEMQELGGLHAYQLASKLGQSRERGGDSSKVLIGWLNGMRMKPSAVEDKHKLRMLEIGALTPRNYASCSTWINNHPIDLNSQHPDIVQQDFFERPLPSDPTEAFDIVSCSLVLNFVSSPTERGNMLRLIHKQLEPSQNSLLFLVLPLPCVANSRYLSTESLVELMQLIGFKLEQCRWRSSSKVGYWLWRWTEVDEADPERPRQLQRWRKKTIEIDGPKRNNFAIVLP